MKNLLSACLLLLVITACNDAEEKKSVRAGSDKVSYEDENLSPAETVALKIAKANGIENWDDVEALRFTFNVDRGDNHFERSWIWEPKSDNISMNNGEETVEYNRRSMDSVTTATDKGFINDSYWLLAPYHLVWDEEANLTVQDTATSPMNKELLSKITITYGDEGGYTPGDAYDFFYDDDFMVREWIFRKGNGKEWSMVTTWEDYEDFNGIKIAKTHNTEGDQVKLYFTGISVDTEE